MLIRIQRVSLFLDFTPTPVSVFHHEPTDTGMPSLSAAVICTICLILYQMSTSMRNDAQLLLLNKDDVEKLLTMDQVLAAVKRAFVLHSESKGRVFPVVREQLSTGGIFGIKSGDG